MKNKIAIGSYVWYKTSLMQGICKIIDANTVQLLSVVYSDKAKLTDKKFLPGFKINIDRDMKFGKEVTQGVGDKLVSDLATVWYRNYITGRNRDLIPEHCVNRLVKIMFDDAGDMDDFVLSVFIMNNIGEGQIVPKETIIVLSDFSIDFTYKYVNLLIESGCERPELHFGGQSRKTVVQYLDYLRPNW